MSLFTVWSCDQRFQANDKTHYEGDDYQEYLRHIQDAIDTEPKGRIIYGNHNALLAVANVAHLIE